MAAIDPALLEAAGFTGASAAQNIGSAQQKAAINTNQLNLAGQQERRGLSAAAEARGMLRSSMTTKSLAEQSAEQTNKQQLIDLGLADTIAGNQLSVMQELAQQQAQQEAMAQQRAMFDAQMQLRQIQLDLENPEGTGIDYEKASQIAGAPISNTSTVRNRGW